MVDLAADSAIFTGDFGETVRFRPSPGGSIRSVKADVNRRMSEPDSAGPHEGHRSPAPHVLVQNDGTDGIQPSEVDPNVSELELEMPLGGSKRWRKINRVLGQNAGVVILEVIN